MGFDHFSLLLCQTRIEWLRQYLFPVLIILRKVRIAAERLIFVVVDEEVDIIIYFAQLVDQIVEELQAISQRVPILLRDFNILEQRVVARECYGVETAQYVLKGLCRLIQGHIAV